MDITTENAGGELIKAALKLYRTGKFFSEKEVLAKRFLNLVLDAGELTEEFAQSFDANVKMTAATKAAEELKKAEFLLKVMCEESYFPERKAQPFTETAEQVKTLLSPYAAGTAQGGYYQQITGGYPQGGNGFTGY